MRPNISVYRAPPDREAPFSRYFAQPSVLQPLWSNVPRSPPNLANVSCYQLQQPHHLNPNATRTHQQPQSMPQLNALYNNVPPPQIHHSTANGHFALPPLVNQQRVNECAGIPLISNSCSHLTPSQRQRMLRKATHSPKNWTQTPPPTPNSKILQLAVHAQGMPLLQTHKQRHQQTGAHWSYNSTATTANSHKLSDKTRGLRYQSSKLPVPHSKEQQAPVEHPPGNSSSGQDVSPADTCLPRIIKPRKRRKKDRKPMASGVFLEMDVEVQPATPSSVSLPVSFTRKPCSSAEELLGSLKGTPNTSACHTVPVHLSSPSTMLPYTQQQQLQLQQHPVSQQHDDTHGVCFCRDCDPLRSLWDYPLRRSLSDSSSEQCSGSSSTSSMHSSSDTSCASSVCSQSMHNNNNNNFDETEHFAPITGSSSRANIVGVIGSQRSGNNSANSNDVTVAQNESNDSVYGDILSGINIADDLFGNSINSNTKHSPFGRAERLLNESINEISRKLIETCAVNETAPSGPIFVAAVANSCSSDTGIESAGSYKCDALVFNFDHLNLADTNFSLTPPTALDILLDCNNNNGNIKAVEQQQFYNNCFDLVWRQQRDADSKDASVKDGGSGSDSSNNNATPTSLGLGTVEKLKPAFSTTS
ncbi:uncharacterized protein LOC115625544 [Scaptodrosophila lebanonensis]|uniref:Uncharacterized protein LOC115625544 n=1 Tax=Drosophila lebanonensis TaxID=7225 RepID=A0A6J2TIH5_DROLE|nr:uncharacterized protein LOC115625544 [Scaptodrosophila lebanonensis]